MTLIKKIKDKKVNFEFNKEFIKVVTDKISSNDAEFLSNSFKEMHPADAADIVEHLSQNDRESLIKLNNFKIDENLFDDFCITPFHPEELEIRLNNLFVKFGLGTEPELIKYGSLVLNIETYQATIDDSPLDLTYMEYELLRFLAMRPGKVFTRETLLSEVWGYDYYGGGRTVDVHIRRLRAKLGEEHANLISTVRSVGYRFGQSRWGS